MAAPAQATPPDFYSTMAQSIRPGGGAPPAPEQQKDPASEVIKAFAAVYKVFDKVKEIMPTAATSKDLAAAKDAINRFVAGVLHQDPKAMDQQPQSDADVAPAPDTTPAPQDKVPA